MTLEGSQIEDRFHERSEVPDWSIWSTKFELEKKRRDRNQTEKPVQHEAFQVKRGSDVLYLSATIVETIKYHVFLNFYNIFFYSSHTFIVVFLLRFMHTHQIAFEI